MATWKRVFIAIAVAIFVLPIERHADAQQWSPGELVVEVYNERGEPVEGTPVTARSLETGRSHSGRTGPDGTVKFDEGIAAGWHYEVSISGLAGTSRTISSPSDERRGRSVFNTSALVPVVRRGHSLGDSRSSPDLVTAFGNAAAGNFRRDENESGEDMAQALERLRSESTVNGVRFGEMEDGVVDNILVISELPFEQRERIKSNLSDADSASEKLGAAQRMLGQTRQEAAALERVPSVSAETREQYRKAQDALLQLISFYSIVAGNEQRGQAANQALENLAPLRRAARQTDDDRQSAVPGGGEAQRGIRLEYTLVDQDDVPVADARVVARYTDGSRTVTAVSDIAGRVVLELPLDGPWDITISADGYQTRRTTYNVFTAGMPPGSSRLDRKTFPMRAIEETGYRPATGHRDRFVLFAGVRADRQTGANFAAGPLQQGINNPTSRNLFNFDTDLWAANPFLELELRPGGGVDVPFLPPRMQGFTPKIKLGAEGSTGSTTERIGQLQVPNPFNATFPAIDGSNVFNLNNNLQNVNFETSRSMWRVHAGGALESAVSNATSWSFGATIDGMGVYESTELSFLNGNQLNTLDIDIDYHGIGLTFEGGPTILIADTVVLNITGFIGPLWLMSDLDASQRAGNQNFRVQDSDSRVTYRGGVTIALEWAPFTGSSSPMLAGTTIGIQGGFEHLGASPIPQLARLQGQRTTIGYSGRSRFHAGAQVRVPLMVQVTPRLVREER